MESHSQLPENHVGHHTCRLNKPWLYCTGGRNRMQLGGPALHVEQHFHIKSIYSSSAVPRTHPQVTLVQHTRRLNDLTAEGRHIDKSRVSRGPHQTQQQPVPCLIGTALLPGLAAVAAYCKRIASGGGGVHRSNTEMTHVMMKKVHPLSLMQTSRRCGSAQQTMYRMLTLPRTARQLLHSPAVANVRSQHRPAHVAGT